MAEDRLQKILSQAGVASRRQAEKIMLEGRVTVNGAVTTELGSKADLERDHVKVDGRLLHPPKRLSYIVLNKPNNTVTTVSDPQHPDPPHVQALRFAGGKAAPGAHWPTGTGPPETRQIPLPDRSRGPEAEARHPRFQRPETRMTRISEALHSSRIIAVVGLSSKRFRPSHGVAEYLQRAGYRIIPVNPQETRILGEPCYPDLDAVPGR